MMTTNPEHRCRAAALELPDELFRLALKRLRRKAGPLYASKAATIAAYGEHAVQLLQLPLHEDRLTYWVELRRLDTDTSIDAFGCATSSQARLAAADLLTEAQHRNETCE